MRTVLLNDTLMLCLQRKEGWSEDLGLHLLEETQVVKSKHSPFVSCSEWTYKNTLALHTWNPPPGQHMVSSSPFIPGSPWQQVQMIHLSPALGIRGRLDHRWDPCPLWSADGSLQPLHPWLILDSLPRPRRPCLGTFIGLAPSVSMPFDLHRPGAERSDQGKQACRVPRTAELQYGYPLSFSGLIVIRSCFSIPRRPPLSMIPGYSPLCPWGG